MIKKRTGQQDIEPGGSASPGPSSARADSDERTGPEEVEGAIKPRPISWLCSILFPMGVYFYLKQQGLGEHETMFAAAISVSLTLWLFSLLSAFIAPLFGMLLILLFGLAPSEVVLSGFSSDSFMLTFSVLGLGAVVTSSGLIHRYTLSLLKILPQNTFWYQAALFFTGLLFTPVVPSIPGRTAIVAPIFGSLITGMEGEKKEKTTAMLYSGGLDSTTYLSAIFLTGAPANLFIYGLLPAQDQQTFQFLYWLYAASITGGIMLVMYFVLSSLFFNAYGKTTVDKERIASELEKLGKMSWQERISLLSILLLAAGIATSSLHKINIPLTAFTIFFALIYLGILSPREFKNKIDWSFLFLLSSVVGIVNTMKYMNIDKILVANLSWLGGYMRDDFQLFILILCGMIVLVRFFLPMATTNFIFASALLPVAGANGVSPWLIGFVILIITETSFANYQSPHIVLFRDKNREVLGFNEKRVTLFRCALFLVKLGAIFASVPFWRHVGIL